MYIDIANTIKKNIKISINTPLEGSFAKVCIEFKIPDLTKKVPDILNEKVAIDRMIDHDFKDNLFSNKAWFTISFFLLCLIIFPLAFGSSQYLELNVSISAIWISTLFANLIALDHMYKEDYNDGTLLYYIVNKVPLAIVV